MSFAKAVFAASFAALLTATGLAGAQEASQTVIVYDYAVNHPIEDSSLANVPTIGASVPQSVTISTVEGAGEVYGYFYYQGQPVIVDLSTRSVVRFGS